MPRIFVASCSDHTPARSTDGRARSAINSDVKLKLSVMELVDGNDGGLDAGIAVASTMQSIIFV